MKFNKTFQLVLLLLCMQVSAFAQTKIACVGNSITEGYSLNWNAGERPWPEQLANLLGRDYQVINCGRSGDTMLRGIKWGDGGNRSYWGSTDHGYTEAKNSRPDVVIIALGTNDAGGDVWNSINNPESQFKTDYTDMINEFKAINGNVKVFVCLPPTIYADNQNKMDGWHNQNLENKLIPIIKQVAQETGSTVIDLHSVTANHRNDLYNDDLHPNVKGAELLAGTIYDALYKSLINVNLNKYQKIDWGAKADSYYHSAGNKDQTPGTSNEFVCSNVYSRDDLPVGTVIQVDEGYMYRPEAWLTATSTNTNPRPEPTRISTMVISDEWWGDYSYRAFNVTRVNGGALSVNDATAHFRIYLPKVLGDGGDFKILSTHNKPLVIANDSQDNNAGLVQDDSKNSNVWSFEYAGNGYYYIINKNSGKALDIPGGSTQEDTQPIQWDVNRNRNQQWNVVEVGNGLYRISPKGTPSMGLDLTGGRADNGTTVVQWPYSSKSWEKWTLTAVENLSSKINAVNQGGTFKLDKDYSDAVTINQGKDVTIDLNGHKLSSTSNYVIRNNGRLRIIDSVGNGSIEIEKRSDSNIEAVINENSGTLIVESGTIFGKVSGGGGIAVGIHNRGRIERISGGDIKAWTYGTAYAYGLWNEGGNVDITDGWFYGAGLADTQTWKNSLAVNNASGTVNISGGVFIGKTRTEGDGYGIRSAGTANLSGGSFVGMNCMGYFRYDNYNDPFDKYDDDKGGMKTLAIRKDGNGSVNYQNNTWHTTNLDGPQVVLTRDQHYVTFVDEAEMTIATYVLDGNGNIAKKWGHIQNSYDVYFGTKTEAVTEADLARYGGNTILYVNTGDKRETMYFLGSSVTQGTNDHGNSWADYVGDRYGDQVIIRKRALSGTTLVNTEDASYIGRMLDQIPTTAKVDHLIVQLSTNDSGWGLPIGTLGPQNEFRSKYYDNRINDFGKQGSREIINGMEFIIAYAMETWGCKVTFWSGPDCSRDSYTKMEDALTKQIEPKWRDKGMGVIDYYHMWYPQKGVVIADDMVHPYQEGYWQMVPYAYDYFKDFDARVVERLINEIGNVTDEGTVGERIEKARFVYDNMMRDAKANVGNYNKLVEAENKYKSFFDGTRKIENNSEVTALKGPAGGQFEDFGSLFDGKIGTKAGSWNYVGNPFIWKFEEPMAVKYYYFTTANDNFWWTGRSPKSWVLYGSNDSDDNGNGTWTKVDEVNNDNTLPDLNYYAGLYKVNNPARFSYYKLEVTAPGNGAFLQVSEMTLYEDLSALSLDPATITPYVTSDGGQTWQSVNTLTVKQGDSFAFGPQANQPGTWSWRGPNGFTSNQREFTINNVTAAQAGDYVLTFYSQNGTQTVYTFTLTVEDPTGIRQASEANVAVGRIFNLNGQEVKSVQKGGIYITNGRKFVVN